MERQARILQQPPSQKEFEGINNCRRAAWDRRGRNYYPYAAFGNYESWQANGELGEDIVRRRLFVSVVQDENNEIVAHAALVKNKYGIELGRVFASKGGHGYGIEAVNGARREAERLGIHEVHMGVSYNRTAMWRAFEESFGNHGWQLAILGILPDIYQEHDMQWGEILSRGVKGKKLIMPKVPEGMPSAIKQFVKNIQQLNNHCVEFDKKESLQKSYSLPYELDNQLIALDWQDSNQQQFHQQIGYRPVGVIPLDGVWRVIMHKGTLPSAVEGVGKDLQYGRNPIIYPKYAQGVNITNIMKVIYNN